jgi:hypothetical protein
MTKKLMPVMLERIRACTFCGKEITGIALSFEENPYCGDCRAKRVTEAAKGTEHISWERSGDYLQPIDLRRRRPQ